MTASTSARPGRNQPCYCGSGRKYKQCCREKDDALAATARAEAAAAATSQAESSDVDAEPSAPARTRPRQTHQPWKAATSKGFAQRMRAPRKVGGS